MLASKKKVKVMKAGSKSRPNSSTPASLSTSGGNQQIKRAPLKKCKKASKMANSKRYTSLVKQKCSSVTKQKAKKKAVKGKAQAKSVTKFVIPSEAPTALIAPSDYEHIFTDPEGDANSGAQQKAKMKSKPQSANKFVITSEAPTALIAPSDYEHIFNDPDDGSGKGPSAYKMQTKTKAPPKSATKFVIPEAPIAWKATSDYHFKGDPVNRFPGENKDEDDSQSQQVVGQQDEYQEMVQPAKGVKDKSQAESGGCCCVLM